MIESLSIEANKKDELEHAVVKVKDFLSNSNNLY
jgi:hypothetical protein